MQSFFLMLTVAAMGILAGVAATLFAPIGMSKIQVGPWYSDWNIGSKHADPYLRAHVARRGILSLTKEEAVYFLADHDSDGKRLWEACNYHVSGAAMPADWWSITLYDEAAFLADNSSGAYSFDATDAGSDGWKFVVAPSELSGDTAWISSENSGNFNLTLRLYKPSAELISAPNAALTLPQIQRLECMDG